MTWTLLVLTLLVGGMTGVVVGFIACAYLNASSIARVIDEFEKRGRVLR